MGTPLVERWWNTTKSMLERHTSSRRFGGDRTPQINGVSPVHDLELIESGNNGVSPVHGRPDLTGKLQPSDQFKWSGLLGDVLVPLVNRFSFHVAPCLRIDFPKTHANVVIERNISDPWFDNTRDILILHKIGMAQEFRQLNFTDVLNPDIGTNAIARAVQYSLSRPGWKGQPACSSTEMRELQHKFKNSAI